MNVKICDYHLYQTGEVKPLSRWITYGFKGRRVRRLHLCQACKRILRLKNEEQQLEIIQKAENSFNTNPQFGVYSQGAINGHTRS